jgi:hypothetical protein
MKRKLAPLHYVDDVSSGSTRKRVRERMTSRLPLGEIPSVASTVWTVSRE